MNSKSVTIVCFTIYVALAAILPMLLSGPGGNSPLYFLMAVSMVWPVLRFKKWAKLLPIGLVLIATVLFWVDYDAGLHQRAALQQLREQLETRPAPIAR
jgi:hypothetical protein